MRYQSLALVALVTIAAIVFGTLFAGRSAIPSRPWPAARSAWPAATTTRASSVKSKNEVGVLADTFNQMGDEIQKAFLEIQRQAT
jgi:nitrate/nitrite-specific signal transduction histidine kinase